MTTIVVLIFQPYKELTLAGHQHDLQHKLGTAIFVLKMKCIAYLLQYQYSILLEKDHKNKLCSAKEETPLQMPKSSIKGFSKNTARVNHQCGEMFTPQVPNFS